MSAVLIGDITAILEQRRRLGLDKQDECWEGEWHLVNPPKEWHQFFGGELFLVLGPLAKAAGLRAYPDATGLFASETDWRIPDQMFARPADAFEDGLRSAELVVELRSPGDDSYKKLPFYAARGVDEVLIIHEDRRVELYCRRDDGEMVRVTLNDDGARSAVLDCTFHTIDGPALRITWSGGTAEV